MRITSLFCVVVAVASSGCETARMYDGPRLPYESVSIVEARSSRATIERIDGQKVGKSAIELMPGDHDLEFSWSTRQMIASLFPVMETDCHVEARLEAGRRYRFEQNESMKFVGKRPPQNFRWTIYRVDPKLVDDTGSEIGAITCKPTCRAHGRKLLDERAYPCEGVLELRVVQPPQDEGDSHPAISTERAALARIIFDRLQASCASLRDSQEELCRVRRVSNNISYLSEDGRLFIFYPDDATSLRPGLRGEARAECLGGPAFTDTPACLNAFGWVLLR